MSHAWTIVCPKCKGVTAKRCLICTECCGVGVKHLREPHSLSVHESQALAKFWLEHSAALHPTQWVKGVLRNWQEPTL